MPKFWVSCQNSVNPMLLVGTETSDDAAVYKINDDLAMIQTVDFFTPVVDDPYLFGQIAAANALSDVYAMGEEPKVALNLAAFPDCLDIEILGEILKGGADKVIEAGAVLAGGHTTSDNEPKYGLCVSGFVNPKLMWKNYGAKPAMCCPYQTAWNRNSSTAIKGELAAENEIEAAVKNMTYLNRYARDIAAGFTIHSCTDITGFGIAGHAMEMAKGSGKTLVLDTGSLPVLKGVQAYTEMGLIPAGAYRNRAYLERDIESQLSGIWLEDLVYDPQTSGGLLLAVSREDAHELLKKLNTLELPSVMIGEVTEKQEKFLILK